jgi:hypothetical protein
MQATQEQAKPELIPAMLPDHHDANVSATK